MELSTNVPQFPFVADPERKYLASIYFVVKLIIVNRIRLLSEHVANQIAAGEVVERPSSVVKELVENSIDAGAARITVEISAGGRGLIRVTDDGSGMSKDDALMCLERHATSKLSKAEDLSAITSMGFRGEAIPSIASVSRFTLTTRERSDPSGEATHIEIQGGKITGVKVASNPPGTSVEVRQLFFNLPARRKFLRAEETERAHIQHYLTLAALAHPEIGFSFLSDGRLIWQLPPARWSDQNERLPALRERLRQLRGNDAAMLRVDCVADLEASTVNPNEIIPDEHSISQDQNTSKSPSRSSKMRIWGLIGAPGVSRATRDEQHLFVNQRPVENRGLNFALIEGYHTALMKGRFPVCCLFLEIDPAAVDVNIHPQKREIKFREEYAVRRLVTRAVRDALVQFHANNEPQFSNAIEGNAHPNPANDPRPRELLQIPLPGSSVPEPASAQPSGSLARRPARISPPGPEPKLPPSRLINPEQPQDAGISPNNSVLAGSTVPVSATPNSVDAIATLQTQTSLSGPSTPPTGSTPVTATDLRPSAPAPLLKASLRVVGVVGRLYVVLESDRGLVLLDQHAAHERILFEQMLRRLESSESAPSQRLLLPETVELSPRDAEFIRRNLETLGRLGVGLREFGDRTFLLDALPPFAKASNPRQFAFELIDQLKAAGDGVNSLRLGEDIVAKTVCRHAVKANDPLHGRELDHLVEDLRRCVMPYTCPHGRPTIIEFSWRDLEKKFGRAA